MCKMNVCKRMCFSFIAIVYKHIAVSIIGQATWRCRAAQHRSGQAEILSYFKKTGRNPCRISLLYSVTTKFFYLTESLKHCTLNRTVQCITQVYEQLSAMSDLETFTSYAPFPNLTMASNAKHCLGKGACQFGADQHQTSINVSTRIETNKYGFSRYRQLLWQYFTIFQHTFLLFFIIDIVVPTFSLLCQVLQCLFFIILMVTDGFPPSSPHRTQKVLKPVPRTDLHVHKLHEPSTPCLPQRCITRLAPRQKVESCCICLCLSMDIRMLHVNHYTARHSIHYGIQFVKIVPGM